jgi:hypothetical protein
VIGNGDLQLVPSLPPNYYYQGGLKIEGPYGCTSGPPPPGEVVCNGQASAPNHVIINDLVSTDNFGPGVALIAGTDITFNRPDIERNAQGGIAFSPYGQAPPLVNPPLDDIHVVSGKIDTDPPSGGWPVWGAAGPPSDAAAIWPPSAIAVKLLGTAVIGSVELKGDPGHGLPLDIQGMLAPVLRLTDLPMTAGQLLLTDVNAPVLPNPAGVQRFERTRTVLGTWRLKERTTLTVDPNGQLLAPAGSVYTTATTKWTTTGSTSSDTWNGDACVAQDSPCAEESDCCAGLVCNLTASPSKCTLPF